MQLYGIQRRNAWATRRRPRSQRRRNRPKRATSPTPGSAGSAATSSREESGELGTFCVYEGESPEAIRAHAEASGMQADEVVPIADTVVVRPDPLPSTAEARPAPSAGGRRSDS